MCDSPADPRQVARAAPRPVTGQAADPIALEPVDEVVITTLVDNVYDALLTGDERTTRAPFSAGTARAPQFEGGSTTVGLMAEHGFSALVSVRRGTTTTTLLFDTGLSPDAMITNAGRLGVDLSQIQAVVLSHGHFDHAGGLAGLAGHQGIRSLPMVDPPADLDAPPPGRAGPRARGAAHAQQASPGGRGVRADRAAAAVAPRGRLRPDYRRGRPDHRLRARHAPVAPGVDRLAMAPGPARRSTTRPWS